MSLPIEEYFRYHPPVSDDRKNKHERINQFALQFAKAIDEELTDPVTKQYAIFAVQQARMFANQGITVDELLTIQNQENIKDENNQ